MCAFDRETLGIGRGDSAGLTLDLVSGEALLARVMESAGRVALTRGPQRMKE